MADPYLDPLPHALTNVAFRPRREDDAAVSDRSTYE
ncbi:MAG: hypothetical protein RL216_3432 [Pseudomonadota bacterium]|jgi:hypothetical protein